MTTRRITRAMRIRLEDFDFHDKLGEGAYGKVYLATHRDTLTRVALKMVKKKSMLGNPTSTLIEREVLEMVQNIPFCAQAYATFQTENHLFFVMEYMGQGDLAHQIEKTWLPLPTIRRMSAELLCGLQHLHSRGIFHRDLKPANILIHLNGHVYIADFGSAATGMFGRYLQEDNGTILYYPPELIKEQPHNQVVDYFSLGVLLYEAAFGAHPFLRGGIKFLLDSIENETPFYPDDTDPNLVDFLQRLLCKEPDERERAIADIEHHPFFQGINWEELAAGETDPPFPVRRKSHRKQRRTIINLEDVMNPEEAISDQEEAISDQEEAISDQEEAISDQEEAISDQEEDMMDQEEDMMDQEEDMMVQEEEMMDQQEAISASEQALFNGFSFISEEWIAMQE
ncbi:protein kinase C theta type-like [Aquarana catesbeiana]|uniref:protein kinase C theta type-like n=1 Tax=Aquarana catesbeiana TaxID=8400 RepID=UPI003CCA092D